LAHFNTYQRHTHDGVEADMTFWLDTIDLEILVEALDVYMHDDAAFQDVATPIFASRMSAVFHAALEYVGEENGDDYDDEEED
jgi:hypothetical protein